ncbi:MAG: hypothetical protein WCL37_07065, partial [Chrysiogenales bacterium]
MKIIFFIWGPPWISLYYNFLDGKKEGGDKHKKCSAANAAYRNESEAKNSPQPLSCQDSAEKVNFSGWPCRTVI